MTSEKRTIVVMLSGGIDSLYTLAKLLAETEHALLVHHLHLLNAEGRHGIEGERCREIVAYCRRHYRDFAYTESLLDHRAFSFFGFDMVAVGFEAGLVAHSHFRDRGRMPDHWAIGHCAEETSHPERFRHVEACLAANCWPQRPPSYLALPVVSKRAELAYLPPALRELAWSCRTPLEAAGRAVACGRCRTCRLMADLHAAA